MISLNQSLDSVHQLEDALVVSQDPQQSGKHKFEEDFSNLPNKKSKFSKHPTIQDSLEAIDRQLFELEAVAKKIFLILENSSEENELLKTELQSTHDKYDQLQLTKKMQIRELQGNSVALMARKTTLLGGTRLYHCCTLESAKSILQQGIQRKVHHNFENPDMGNGLYCSLEMPAYISANLPVGLILEVISSIPAALTKSYEAYLTEKEFSFEMIQEGYLEIQKNYPILIHEGLYPSGTERIIQDPLHKIRVLGLLFEYKIQDLEHIEENEIEPANEWMQKEQITLHSSWAK